MSYLWRLRKLGINIARMSSLPDALASRSHRIVALAETLRAGLLPLQARIKLAALFGSVAKGTDHESSDIDLLVVADDLLFGEVYSSLANTDLDVLRVDLKLYTRDEFRRRIADGGSVVSGILRGPHVVLVEEDARPPAPS